MIVRTSHLSAPSRRSWYAWGSALLALASFWLAAEVAQADRLVPQQAYMNAYSLPYLGGVAAAGGSAGALAILDNGIVDHDGANDRIDTWQSDSSDGFYPDFVGLGYGQAAQFDSITIELGYQHYLEATGTGYENNTTGGDWEAMPKLYILRNSNLLGVTTEPSRASNWVEITGTITTSHTFDKYVSAAGPGETITFDLSAIPAAIRTGWGWAVGGVDGNSYSSGGPGNFVSLTEAYANGVPTASPSQITAPTAPMPDGTPLVAGLSVVRPSNVICNRYHSPGVLTATDSDLPNSRGPAYLGVTNDSFLNSTTRDGFRTFDAVVDQPKTDFVGLQYSSQVKFDHLVVNMARGTYQNGGYSWDTRPHIYILKQPVDRNTLRPEENLDIWEQIPDEQVGLKVYGTGGAVANTYGADITDTWMFSSTEPSPSTNGVNFFFDLTAVAAAARTGWGWAIGGVDGSGTENFVQVSELRGIGTVIANEYGDFNADGKVDAADYVVWRYALDTNPTAILPNDPTPGTVTADDYLVWRQFFGYDNATGSALGTTAVPEPTTGFLALLALGGIGFAGRRRKNGQENRQK